MSATSSSITAGVEIGNYGTMNEVFFKCIGKAVKARFVSYERSNLRSRGRPETSNTD